MSGAAGREHASPPTVLPVLPVQRTSFVGREAELDALAGLVRASRLVTITGAAGMGKTRLAIEVARRMADARFAGLSALADPELVPQEVASALGVREQAGEALELTLATRVGDGPSLLLLDNCEHVVEACAALVEGLLRACAGLRVVATSLRPLRVPGEVVWRIEPLGVPARRPDASPQAIAASDAVRLFEARARRVRPGFAVDAANADAVALVCRRLDGIPLAIELAAARLERLSVADLEACLEDRFRVLADPPARGEVARHRTLRAALDWGHDLLDEPARLLFRRLSVFGGSFDLAAAEAVCSGAGLPPDEVAGWFFRLAESSLVVPDTDRPGPARYRLLQTVRQYAAERLAASGEQAAVQRAHAAHFLALAREAARAERGPDQRRWLERLELELDNLRLALGWCRACHAGSWLRLAGALSWFWVTRGYFREGLGWLEGALASQAAGVPERARGLLGAARLSFWRGDYPAARSRAEACLELSEQRSAALALLGAVHAANGEYDDGRRRYEQALAAAGDQHDRLEALVGMGEMLLQAGHLAEARCCLDEVAAPGRGPESPRGRAALFLGIAALLEGDGTAARTHLVRSLGIFERLGNRYAAAAALDGLAAVAVGDSDPLHALRLSGAAAAARASIGSRLTPRWAAIVQAVVLDPARAAAGDQAAAAWAEGGRLPFEAAVRVAIVYGSAPPEQAPPAPGPAPAGLTRRELEVAELVVQGLTNREIAARLVIAERTVEGHVERIRGKLRVHSRTQIGASMMRERAWPTGALP